MIVLRWGSLLLAVVCLVVVMDRRQYDGVWLLGVLSVLVFLATLGVFSRWFWTDAPKPERDVRTEHAAARMWVDLQVDDLDRGGRDA